jgi:hypothetical protein
MKYATKWKYSNINKKVHMIPPEEIEQAVLTVIMESYGADEETIATSVFQTLGFARVIEDMRGVILPIINSLIATKVLVNKGSVLVFA